MSAKSKTAAADASNLRTNEKKWSKPLMDAGWTAFPSVIIENQKQLGLTPMPWRVNLRTTLNTLVRPAPT